MKDITDVAFESYKEDLKSYDNPDYVINYPKYDWKMSYIAYDAMLKEYTDYHNLNQPNTDYEAFGFFSNCDVTYLCNYFLRFYKIKILNKEEYKHTYLKKGFVKCKDRIYYCIESK